MQGWALGGTPAGGPGGARVGGRRRFRPPAFDCRRAPSQWAPAPPRGTGGPRPARRAQRGCTSAVRGANHAIFPSLQIRAASRFVLSTPWLQFLFQHRYSIAKCCSHKCCSHYRARYETLLGSEGLWQSSVREGPTRVRSQGPSFRPRVCRCTPTDVQVALVCSHVFYWCVRMYIRSWKVFRKIQAPKQFFSIYY